MKEGKKKTRKKKEKRKEKEKKKELELDKKTKRITRPDTWLPKLRAGGQGLFLRSLDHLGRSSEAKDRKNKKK